MTPFAFKFKHDCYLATSDVVRWAEREAIACFSMVATLGNNLRFAVPSAELTAIFSVGMPEDKPVSQHI
jgi:hypothetical protein